MMDTLAKRYGSAMHVVFRVLVGLMFFLHGGQKFGWFGGQAQPLMGLMGAAGIIEIVVGLLVLVGFWTRFAAAVGAVEMIVAYGMVHASGGWNPLVNKGELALLYLGAFLVLVAYGAGPWRLDKK